MRLAVSNIAWAPDDDPVAAAALAAAGVDAIEVAPTVRWPAPLDVSRGEAVAWRAWWQARGIDIVAMQSLLFGRPDLAVFGPPDVRAALVDYVGGLCRLAGWLGATRLVFGSPANRRPGGLPAAVRDEVAVEVFHAIGRRAHDEGVAVCIEANPRAYGCEWIEGVAEAAALVTAVDHPGFGLHLDAGGMLLHGDTIDDVARVLAAPGARHVHASDPSLAPLGEGDARSPRWHADLAALLARRGYDGAVSLEMRRQDGDRAALLGASLARLTAWYGAAPRIRR